MDYENKRLVQAEMVSLFNGRRRDLAIVRDCPSSAGLPPLLVPTAKVSVSSSASSIASSQGEDDETEGRFHDGSPMHRISTSSVELPPPSVNRQDSVSCSMVVDSPSRKRSINLISNNFPFIERDSGVVMNDVSEISRNSFGPTSPCTYNSRGRCDLAKHLHSSLPSVLQVSPSPQGFILIPPSPQDSNTVLRSPQQPPMTTLLLAQPEDEKILSPLHVFMRKQIEVFTATRVDISQPAPGRKNTIHIDQVGLRCIHCRDIPARKRVKRAVCYPTSVGRVYHSVSDMKLDHFLHCTGVPQDARNKLVELKQEGKKKVTPKKSSYANPSFASTAQYYHDAAMRMGMVDTPRGVFMAKRAAQRLGESGGLGGAEAAAIVKEQMSLKRLAQQSQTNTAISLSRFPIRLPSIVDSTRAAQHQLHQQQLQLQKQQLSNSSVSALLECHRQMVFQRQARAPVDAMELKAMVDRYERYRESTMAVHQQAIATDPAPAPFPTVTLPQTKKHGVQNKSILLASSMDNHYLNEIHCFVRRHVEVFEATAVDVDAPSPGRRSKVQVGQVGIRCIHCATVHHKMRVKRSVCYPLSVNGIYHSVANMKFDHFGNCRVLPAPAREEFNRLRQQSSKILKDNNKKMLSLASTAQYYLESAKKLGLVDTEGGIRFASSLAQLDGNNASHASIDSDKGMSVLMMAATDPRVASASEAVVKMKDNRLQ